MFGLFPARWMEFATQSNKTEQDEAAANPQHITTEAADRLTTESGNELITEG